jgi:general secretion pathway protein N
VKKLWLWLALGVGAYVVFALSMFPAGAAVRWFVPPEVMLNGVQGTVWSGSAANGTVAGFPLQDLRWRLRPWTLVMGRIAGDVEVRLPDGFVNSAFTATTRRMTLSNLRGGTSLATLGATVPALRGTRGQASVELSTLELENGWFNEVRGSLKIAALEITPFIPNGSSNLLPLGDYTVTFGDAPPQSIAGRFIDNGGPLEVAGTVTLDKAREFAFDALIKPRPGAPQMLVDGLNPVTADPDANGRRRLTLSGSL